MVSVSRPQHSSSKMILMNLSLRFWVTEYKKVLLMLGNFPNVYVVRSAAFLLSWFAGVFFFEVARVFMAQGAQQCRLVFRIPGSRA